MAANLNWGVDNFDSNEWEKNLKNNRIVLDVIDKKLSIVSIVESLGSVLTNDNKDVRRRGVEFMSWLLSQLPQDFLVEKELSFFAVFYVDRLKDHHSVIPATLQGILSMIEMSNISNDSVQKSLHNIFQFVTCQAQLAPDRLTLYNILKTCSERHFTIVKSMEGDFMFGVIASMEGETDPQNLLLIFSFLPSILSRLDIDHLTSDIFEVFSIYFPVDFTTVKKDGVVITREDLGKGLTNCLSATPKLAEESLSLILEKLDSTLKTAKIDSYKLLQSCCKRLNASQLQPSLTSLWKMLQRDLLPPLDNAIQQEALLALSCITDTLNRTSEPDLQHFIDDVIIGVRSLIAKPEDSLFRPAMKVLEALCTESAVATKRVLMEVEVLCRPNKRSDAELYTLLDAILPFLDYMKAEDLVCEVVTSLSIDATSVNCEKVQKVAFTALYILFKKIAVSEKWRIAVYDALLASIRKSSSESVVPECFKLLRLVGEEQPKEVISNVYSVIEEELSSGNLTILTFLNVSESIVDIPDLTNCVLSHYVTFGKSVNTSITLESLLRACRSTSRSSFLYSCFEAVHCLVAWWLQEGEISSLCSLAYILKEIIACRRPEEQSEILTSLEHTLFTAFFGNTSRSQLTVVLVEGAVGALHPKVPVPHQARLIPQLVLLAKEGVEPVVRHSAGRLLAACVNKMDVEASQLLIQDIATSLPSTNSETCVQLLAWALKGALLRGLPNLDPWLIHWFKLLEDPSVSHHVAVYTKYLLSDEDPFLNSSCHCTIRFLYRQRIFSYLPSIAQSLPNVPDPVLRDNYLLALVQVATGVQLQVLLEEEKSVAAVVSLSMQSSDPAVVQLALELLQSLLKEKSSLFADHITSLLPVLLKLVNSRAPLHVRRSALQCLFLCGCYPTILTLPYRTQVLKALVPCLDDHKRVVRAEAVRARSRWCLIGAVGEDAIFPS